MDLLAKASSPDTSIPEDQTADKVVETDSVPKIPLACPERTIKGGRPQGTDLNSWISRQHKKKQNERKTDPCTLDWPEEENPPLQKRRRVMEI